MAVKSWYLSIVKKGSNQAVDGIKSKMFFTAPDMNKWVKEQELFEKYPVEQYYYVRENY